jgi:molybdate transport system substrate-binding protein
MRRPWNKLCLALALAAGFNLSATPAARAAGAEISVYAGATLEDALKEISAAYQKAGGEKISVNLGASSVLARQIEEGAPADVFLSADEYKMDELEKAGLLLPGTRRSLLSNSLVIVVPVDSKIKITSPQDLAGSQVKAIALCEPQTVPAGIYAQQYLRKIGLWDRLVKKLVPTENIRAALAAVESGNVEAGIVFKTDAGVSKQVRIAVEIPAAEGPRISFPVAVVRESRNAAAARKLVAFLESPAGLDIFRKHGFLVPADRVKR